ncbi:MAG: GTP-binding protein [Defluviicoccus sp.]|nr:GTP-binding protein [Defluviicoccus sp.]
MTDSHTPPEPDDIVQASLLTGFLGSGKTTLINALLKHPEMSDTAVLVNEFGEIGLDHHLIEQIDEDTVLLNAGCLCCTVRDDLARALRELFIKRVKGEVPPFGRVVIETTGLADPAPVIHTLMTDRVIANRYALDGVVTAVDGVNGDLQLGRHSESVKQAAVADRIVITKGDIADDEELDGLEASLRALNPGASIVRAEHGAIHPDELFDAGLYDPNTKSLDVQRWLRDEAFDDRHRHDHDVNRHDDSIRAYCLRYDEPLAWEPFVGWIRTLIATHGERLLRIKGIVNVAGQDKPIAIHGVQHLFHDPAQLPEWPDGDTRSRIVFITRDLPRETVERILDDMKAAVAGPG